MYTMYNVQVIHSLPTFAVFKEHVSAQHIQLSPGRHQASCTVCYINCLSVVSALKLEAKGLIKEAFWPNRIIFEKSDGN